MVAAGSFAPLKNRDFALFFWSGGISNAGSAMQAITIPFVVYELTGSRTWLGAAALLGQIPSVLANVVSGTLADRFAVKRLLIGTQAVLMAFAAAFWALWVTGRHDLPLFLFLVVLNGLFIGLVFPVWQSMVAALVPREHLTPAIRMNSLQFALSRVLGPFAGGVALDRWGPGVAFAVNAVSYVIVLAALVAMRAQPSPTRVDGSPLAQIREGWRYTLDHSSLLLACATTAVISLCGWSLLSLSPALAREHFGVSASKTGVINAVNGLGSVSAALVLAVNAQRFARSSTARFALTAWVVGITTVAFAPSLGTGLVGFYVMGFGHTTMVTSLQPAIQIQVDDRYRGRVLGVYMQGVLVGPPVGAFTFGWLSGFTGLRAVLLMAAGLMAVFLAAVSARGGFALLDSDHAVARRTAARGDTAPLRSSSR